ASFSYTTSDGTDTSLPATVTVNVAAINDAPVAVADALAATEDTAVIYTAAQLLGNDTDVDNTNAQLSIASVTSGTGGTAVLNGNGTVTFTPALNFNGAASFTYTTSDGTDTSLPATVTVNVAAINDAPLLAGANPLSDLLPAAVNPGALVSSLISAMLSDVDVGDPAGVVVTFADTANGSWEFSLDDGATWASVGSPTDSAALALAADPGVRLRFVPNAGYLGASSVGLRAWDRSAGAAGAVVDASGNGGSSAYSAASAVAGVAVLAAVPPAPSAAPSPAPSLPPSAAPSPSVAHDPQPVTAPLANIPPIVPNAPESPPVVAPSENPGPSASAASLEEALTGVPKAEILPEGVMLASQDNSATILLALEAQSSSSTGAKSATPASATFFFGVPTVPADSTDTDSLLLGSGFEPSPDGTAAVLHGDGLRDALDQLRDDVKKQGAGDRSTAGAAMVFTGTLSAGYVLWLVRGGVLISSLLSSMPAWRMIDPLPVLARARREEDEEDDSLESMVDDVSDEEVGDTDPTPIAESDGRVEPSTDGRTWS
ncbi:MAG: tandem-95 repeat protein, partial [Burkholderiales bacterium]